jgi:hypothetical protein
MYGKLHTELVLLTATMKKVISTVRLNLLLMCTAVAATSAMTAAAAAAAAKQAEKSSVDQHLSNRFESMQHLSDITPHTSHLIVLGCCYRNLSYTALS